MLKAVTEATASSTDRKGKTTNDDNILGVLHIEQPAINMQLQAASITFANENVRVSLSFERSEPWSSRCFINKETSSSSTVYVSLTTSSNLTYYRIRSSSASE